MIRTEHVTCEKTENRFKRGGGVLFNICHSPSTEIKMNQFWEQNTKLLFANIIGNCYKTNEGIILNSLY